MLCHTAVVNRVLSPFRCGAPVRGIYQVTILDLSVTESSTARGPTSWKNEGLVNIHGREGSRKAGLLSA